MVPGQLISFQPPNEPSWPCWLQYRRPSYPTRVAAQHGDTESLVFLAGVHMENGEWGEAEQLGNDAAVDGDHEALMHLGRGLLQHGARERADAIVLRAVNTAMAESFSSFSGDESWQVLAEVRSDDGLLLTGLDTEGNTAKRWW